MASLKEDLTSLSARPTCAGNEDEDRSALPQVTLLQEQLSNDLPIKLQRSGPLA